MIHSPHPWTQDPEAEAACTIEDAEGNPIIDVYVTRDDSGSITPESQANVDLVEDAPKLLGALAAVVKIVELYGVGDPGSIRASQLAQWNALLARHTISAPEQGEKKRTERRPWLTLQPRKVGRIHGITDPEMKDAEIIYVPELRLSPRQKTQLSATPGDVFTKAGIGDDETLWVYFEQGDCGFLAELMDEGIDKMSNLGERKIRCIDIEWDFESAAGTDGLPETVEVDLSDVPGFVWCDVTEDNSSYIADYLQYKYGFLTTSVVTFDWVRI